VSHTFVLREIRGLRELGLDVHVASIRPADRAIEQMSAEEQEECRATFYIKAQGAAGVLTALLRVPPWRLLTAVVCAFRLARGRPRVLLRNLFYLAEAAIFCDWLKRERLTRVHMHFTTTVGLLATYLAPLKTSATIHGSAEFIDPRGFYLPEKVAAFDRVCAISDYGRTRLERISATEHHARLRVSRLGVDSRVYSARPFRYNPARFEILCVGRLARGKGQNVLIAALDRLRREGYAVSLRLVGDGDQRAALESLAQAHRLEDVVIFEGWQNVQRVQACYQQADLFALASEAEGIPVVLMEAMAMEIPCVATDVMGIPELIRHEVDGLLVPAPAPEAFAQTIARLLSDGELRLRLGKAGRQRVLEHYELAKNTAVLGRILQEVRPLESQGSGC
jgi:glycosyltransferase involved in cell wall biosynthesis